jgi:16S rRNA A1518/A1519 N6-dimethyltransferase RsmA/KsgA/DIM1 with predicted DNA glycosylase/AP lyase activity
MKGAFFYPPPHVDSTAFCFSPKAAAATAVATATVPPLFFALVRALFAQKRKTVYNNLCRFVAANGGSFGLGDDDVPAFCEKALARCAVEKSERAENLKGVDFEHIAAFLTEHEYKRTD